MLSTPHIASVMCKTRFEQIFRFLHLCDTSQQVPAGQPGHDKLFKVPHFLDMFSSAFDQEYNLHQQCSVDEAMIPFKGRVGFKQYMKDKPTKWGIKVFVLADATNGYVKAFQVYTGRTVEGRSDVGLCTKVVLDLLSEYRNSGLTVYMDSYYSSPQLCMTRTSMLLALLGLAGGDFQQQSFLLRHPFPIGESTSMLQMVLC